MDTQSVTGKKVLIVSARVGAGHGQVADALVGQLRLDAPDLCVEHLEVLEILPKAFRLYYQSGYVLSMTRFGRLYGLGFDIFNRPDRPGRAWHENARIIGERFWMGPFIDRLINDQPDLIVNTHFLTTPVIDHIRRQGLLHCPQMVTITDCDPHRWWYAQGVDHWFVPSDDDRFKLARWGIDPHHTTVTTIPVHPKWTAPMDRHRILRDWKLPEDRPIVVLSGGAEFTCGPIEKIARRILAKCPPCLLIVLAGRNKELLGKLSALPETLKGDLRPVSFTDRVQELVFVASLMITKPGGVTTAECCAVGTPMALLKPVPGQEVGNARYFSRKGAAVVANGNGDVANIACELLHDSEKLEQMSRAAESLHLPGTQMAARTILKRLATLD